MKIIKVILIRPEAKWSNYDQIVKVLLWKIELVTVAKVWDEL